MAIALPGASPLPLGTAVMTATALTAATITARRRSRLPDVRMQLTSFNRAVLSRCPTLNSLYSLIPFLSNGHLETIFCFKLRSRPALEPYRRRILSMPDGGSVALDFEDLPTLQDLPMDAPVVILLPGLTGGSHDSYVQHMVRACRFRGLRAVVFNSRGTNDGPVTTPKFYSASFTDDLRAVVKDVQGLFPSSVLLAAGWSLGANILVRYLGEQGSKTPIAAAVSMCNPFDLVAAGNNLSIGFNRIFDWDLATALSRIYRRHAHLFEGKVGPEYNLALAANSRCIREFDDALTKVSFGWRSVDDYYAASSSSLSVPHVAIPLLCIQAEDDPIAPAHAIPYAALEANPNCTLVVTPGGGHLGWGAGPNGPLGSPWTDNASTEWLNSVVSELYRHGALPQRKAGLHSGARTVGGRQGADRPADIGGRKPAPLFF